MIRPPRLFLSLLRILEDPSGVSRSLSRRVLSFLHSNLNPRLEGTTLQ